jgi:hypothetical protein
MQKGGTPESQRELFWVQKPPKINEKIDAKIDAEKVMKSMKKRHENETIF